MVDLRPVFYIIGVLLIALGVAMVIPFLTDWSEGRGHAFVFFESMLITISVGVLLAMGNANAVRSGGLTIEQTLIVTTTVWLILPIFGALPMVIGDSELSWVDGYFEAMSGLTTTGSTILGDLESLPKGILMWRGLLNWLGGVGIIVVAMVFLPELRVGGMQVFRSEGFDTLGKILPRATSIAQQISTVYVGLTLLCTVAYLLLGMNSFDATVHAMTTIATGGFGNYDDSFGSFAPAIQYAAVVFMLLAALPFALYVKMINGDPNALSRDSQVRVFLLIVSLVTGLVFASLIYNATYPTEESLRLTLFNVVSIITGTGYSSANYGLWGNGAILVFFWGGLIGGCAGSTACSVKVFRYQILFSAIRRQFNRVLSPHAVYVARFQGAAINDETMRSVLAFFFVFFASNVALAVALRMTGLDFITSVSGAATALANIGPGLGPIIGPDGNFSSLNHSAKVLLIIGMWAGRLEILAVLALFSRTFWRN